MLCTNRWTACGLIYTKPAETKHSKAFNGGSSTHRKSCDLPDKPCSKYTVRTNQLFVLATLQDRNLSPTAAAFCKLRQNPREAFTNKCASLNS